MQSTPSASVLRQARSHLLEHGDCLPGTIDERVARSWRRSLNAGLLPTGRLADNEHSSGSNLRQALACNHDLLAHSRPVMEYLFEQVRHSHSMVILADNRATLMHTMGDVDFLSKAERVALATGSSWQEQHRGTNAIGTALAEASSVEIHGAEHFLERNGFLTCAAAPIMSAAGELMGVIDISGDQRSRHPHTLGLVSMAARMIENRLVVAACRRHIRLHLHAHPEGIGSVAEGIIAISEDGWVVGANRTGLAMLHLTPADLGATPLARSVDVRFEELLARHRRRPDQPTQVRLHDGSMLYVQVYAEQAALTITPPDPVGSTERCPGPPRYRRSALAQCDRKSETRRRQSDPVADPRRIRRGQGAVCARRARQWSASRRAFCGDQLRRVAGKPDRSRTVRILVWCVHRRKTRGFYWKIARSAWRHAVPG